MIAEFLCQNEDQEYIAEALNIIKRWNPTWKLKYFVVNYSVTEINVVESEFPDDQVYICDFHRAAMTQMRQAQYKQTNLGHAEDVPGLNASNCLGSITDFLSEGSEQV